jgi:GxxExxY protein
MPFNGPISVLSLAVRQSGNTETTESTEDTEKAGKDEDGEQGKGAESRYVIGQACVSLNVERIAMELVASRLTRNILTAALDVHRALGPGLLESSYRACLEHQMRLDGLEVRREVPIPVQFRGLRLDCSYRADLIVNGTVLVELKAVERLLPIHEAQTLTYLKLSGLRVALLLNFNSTSLKHGVRRFVR